MYKPTIGRRVRFHPAANVESRGLSVVSLTQPFFAAIITFVHNLRLVNLTVFDHRGDHHSVAEVQLLQEGELAPLTSAWCKPMPHHRSSGDQQATNREPPPVEQAPVTFRADQWSITDVEAIKRRGDDPVDFGKILAGDTIQCSAAALTEENIESLVASEHYFVLSDALRDQQSIHVSPRGWTLGRTQLVTVCVLQLANGFVVTGESACLNPANFNAETGRTEARKGAIEKLWVLEGYRAQNKIWNHGTGQTGDAVSRFAQ